MDQTGPVINIEGLTKSFGKFRALDGLDLQVRTGQVHGFLGPNGAGKSTTIRVLLGLLKAGAGTVSMLGGDPGDAGPERACLGHRGCSGVCAGRLCRIPAAGRGAVTKRGLETPLG